MTSAAERPGETAVGPSHRTEQLEAVIKGMGDGLILQDENNRLLAINSAAVRMNGFSNEAEARAAFEALSHHAAGSAGDVSPSSLSCFSVLDRDGNELPFRQWPLSRACRHEPFEGVDVTIVNRANGHRWTGRLEGTAIPGRPGEAKLFIVTMQDATERRHAELELREANRRLGMLHEAVSMLLVSDEPLALLDQLYERLAGLLGMQFYFHFAASGGGQFRLIAYRGVSEEVAKRLRGVHFEQSVCGRVATNRRRAVLEDLQTGVDPATEFIRGLGITAYVCCPLVARDTLIGTLSFGTRQRKRFSSADITLIQTVCDQVAIALERERSRVRLHNSEEHLRLALDAGHMGAFDWDLRAGKATWDTAVYRMFGCEPGSVVDIEDFCRRVYPEDRVKLEELQKRQHRGSANELLDVDFRIVRPDGEVRWIASRGRISCDETGRAVRINGISFDVTERKRVEEVERLAHVAGQVGTFHWDIPNGELRFDRQLQLVYGLDAANPIDNYESWLARVHPEDRAGVTTAILNFFETHDESWRYEYRIIRPDGEMRWIEARATTFYDNDGRPRTCIGVNVDITARREAEQALQEADRRKDDFLAALGHELRNPLAPIRNAMQVLRLRAAPDSHARWAAEVTERQVQQMTRLVDDLLDVSRINRGKLELRDETVDVADVARRAVEMTMPLIERRGHRVEVAAPPGPVLVRGDATRLTQVFANLLSNAAKFTPPQGEIQVVVESGEADVRVRVQDNGVGIGASALKDIFDPFQQAHQGVEQDQAGLGLGLALVQRLTQLHGGSVEALSQGAGKGSEFRVRLPRAQAEARRDAIVEMQKPTARLRIVVVDDNRDVAESLSALLEMLGHEAHPVFSGAEAIDMVPRLQPDLVICDIGLPDISGHEVAARLRREPSVQSVRLVAMTGFARDSEKAKRSGFDEWFLKPVDLVTLQSMLARTQPNSAAASRHKN